MTRGEDFFYIDEGFRRVSVNPRYRNKVFLQEVRYGENIEFDMEFRSEEAAKAYIRFLKKHFGEKEV